MKLFAFTIVVIPSFGKTFARTFTNLRHVTKIFMANSETHRINSVVNRANVANLQKNQALLAASLDSVIKSPIAFGVTFLLTGFIQIRPPSYFRASMATRIRFSLR